MSSLHTVYHLARAELFQRIRSYGFLAVMGVAALGGYSIASGQVVLRLDRYTGVYNSTWVGMLMSGTTSLFLSLAGYYVVKGAVERDYQTGVGQIIATTPVSRLTYALGKALSNFCVLACMALILLVAAVAAQWVRGEEMRIEPWPLISPILLISLPVMAFVAALAVFFESIPGLRGGYGSLAYFFLWATVFVMLAALHPSPFTDLTGISLIQDVFADAASDRSLDYASGFSIEPAGFEAMKRIRWESLPWTAARVGMRLYWVGVAIVLVLVAAALSDRFDPAACLLPQGKLKSHIERTRAHPPFGHRLRGAAPQKMPGQPGLTPPWPILHQMPLSLACCRSRFARLLLAELRLALRGQSWWWYAAAAGFVVWGLMSSGPNARHPCLPLAWIWPVLIWSRMGVREAQYGTEQLVFPVPHPLRRQFPATWLAGVCIALVGGSGVGASLMMARDWAGLAAWAVGALFIPTLALALGVWSGTSKLFEAVYVTIWYVGPLNGMTALDFMGTLDRSIDGGVSSFYAVLTILLLGLAVVGRWRQLRGQ